MIGSLINKGIYPEHVFKKSFKEKLTLKVEGKKLKNRFKVSFILNGKLVLVFVSNKSMEFCLSRYNISLEMFLSFLKVFNIDEDVLEMLMSLENISAIDEINDFSLVYKSERTAYFFTDLVGNLCNLYISWKDSGIYLVAQYNQDVFIMNDLALVLMSVYNIAPTTNMEKLSHTWMYRYENDYLEWVSVFMGSQILGENGWRRVKTK